MAERGSIEVRVGATTDRGRVRENNEDAFLVHHPVYAVADGMGGMNAGEVASGLALDTLRAGADSGGVAEVSVQAWVLEANRVVFERARQDLSAAGMGTTLVMVAPDGDRLRLAHVGDSRAYLFRNGALRQLTEDHTKVQRLLKEGLISA